MRPRSLLFTLFGDFVRNYGGEIWVGSLIRLMQEFDIAPQAVRVALSRITADGWLRTRRLGKKSFYGLTAQGERRMAEAASRIYKLDNLAWNGEWLIMTYTIPEKRKVVRDKIRRELSWTGFGQLASSVWISPRDLRPQLIEIAERYDIALHLDFFTARYRGPAENQRLIDKCWNLDAIQQGYAAFIEVYRSKLDQQQPLSEEICFCEEIQLIHEYRKFLFSDPGLPDDLLPGTWLGHEAAHIMREYYQYVAPGAHRFFESVFVGHPDNAAFIKKLGQHPRLDPFAEELRRQQRQYSAADL